MLNESRDTIEIIDRYNEPAERRLAESSVNRLPDGTIWFTVTQGTGGSTDRLLFGKLESAQP